MRKNNTQMLGLVSCVISVTFFAKFVSTAVEHQIIHIRFIFTPENMSKTWLIKNTPINYRKPELMNGSCDRHLNYAVKGTTNSAELMENDFIDLAVNIHYTVVYTRALYWAFVLNLLDT